MDLLKYIIYAKGGEKMKKISFVLALCILFSFGANIIASAEEYAVTPRYNNASNVSCKFNNKKLKTNQKRNYLKEKRLIR